VYIATEKIVRMGYGVRIPPSMMDYSKQRSGDIETLKRNLAGAGYYDDSPHDIRPTPARLERADIGKQLEALVERFAGYDGPEIELHG